MAEPVPPAEEAHEDRAGIGGEEQQEALRALTAGWAARSADGRRRPSST
jgi:hypothetical protein